MNIWYSTNRLESIPISNMTTKHINNSINCLKGLGKSKIPNPYFKKSHKEWIKIFEQELNIKNNKKIIYELW